LEPSGDLLWERFHGPKLNPHLQWFCPPPSYSLLANPSCLELATAASTDFWQRTHYGFQADNGHFLYAAIDGDFLLSTDVEFQGLHQYDQAGLMVRYNADNWLKTSVEFEPNAPAQPKVPNGPSIPNRLGAVLTRDGFSDWSTQDIPKDLHRLQLRIHRRQSTLLVEAQLPQASAFTQLRLAHLEGEGPILAGVYACSPKQAGFRARFYALRIQRL
jgi:hypothetical protein